MRPWPIAGPHENCSRLAQLVELIRQYDIVVLEELFDDSVRARLRSELQAEFNFAGPPAGTPLIRNDGGVVMLSRFPLHDEQTLRFKTCASWDCLAAKGAVAATTTLCNGVSVLLVGTHLQADYPRSSHSGTRAEQIEQLQGWIDRLRSGRSVLLLGDLNVDAGSSEYRETLGSLGMSDVWTLQNGSAEGYTLDNRVNPRADALQRIDYILCRECALAMAPQALTLERGATDPALAGWPFLSDHFGVAGVLEVIGH